MIKTQHPTSCQGWKLDKSKEVVALVTDTVVHDDGNTNGVGLKSAQ